MSPRPPDTLEIVVLVLYAAAIVGLGVAVIVTQIIMPAVSS